LRKACDAVGYDGLDVSLHSTSLSTPRYAGSIGTPNKKARQAAGEYRTALTPDLCGIWHHRHHELCESETPSDGMTRRRSIEILDACRASLLVRSS
jgi:hypothetical protein